MKTLESEVESFLNGFKAKLEVFGVSFLERDKNLQALFDLEITALRRLEILRTLEVKDFYRGPNKDRENGPDLWEFGKTVNRKEVYIKIHMGYQNKSVICVSFHPAERTIVYPFK